MINKIGDIRPVQLITSFGPGAILDAVRDSVTILDINYWQNHGKHIYDSRLASYLGVDYFISPRTSFTEDLPVVSFPDYHVCSNSKCNHLFDLQETFDLEKYLHSGPVCPLCGFKAYPSRFIVSCVDGHLDDFPWRWWVHEGQVTCKKKMYLESIGFTSTLADLRVRCECGASRDMGGATVKENFRGLKCSGRHPHRPAIRKTAEGIYSRCSQAVIPSQRGASNVYFPVIRSAISIPPWVNPLYTLIDEHYRRILDYRADFGDSGVTKVYEKYFKDRYTREEFDEALRKRDEKIKEFTEIKEMEYSAITHFQDMQYSRDQKFFKADEEEIPSYLQKYFNRLIRIQRLREVMVLLGFMRMDLPEPEVDEQKNIVPLTKSKSDPWLPGVTINGEGIFIEFNRDTVDKWLKDDNVSRLSEKYTMLYNIYAEERGWTNVKKRDAVYVLLHTFAHIIIKELSLECGYSSASIKERIYFSNNMCGVLLYTGSSDKEGSLGGLVEMGYISNFTRMLVNALRNAIICTTDPDCMMREPEMEKLKGASCHSCTMISETSCETGNRLLDRSLLITLPGRKNAGYFDELVKTICGIEI